MEQDDQTYISQKLPQLYLMRQVRCDIFRNVEKLYENVPSSTVLLVRREVRMFQGQLVRHDYITTKVNYDTIYGRWTHQYVAYPASDVSPYKFNINASGVNNLETV